MTKPAHCNECGRDIPRHQITPHRPNCPSEPGPDRHRCVPAPRYLIPVTIIHYVNGEEVETVRKLELYEGIFKGEL